LVETLRNYKENQFDYKRNGRCYDATANSTLEEDRRFRSDNSSFDFKGDPEESRKPRRTFSDNVDLRGEGIKVLNETLN